MQLFILTVLIHLLPAISIDEFQHIIEEAKIVVGNPVIIANKPSGSLELADTVSNAFEEEVRAVIIRNHGVVSIGNKYSSSTCCY